MANAEWSGFRPSLARTPSRRVPHAQILEKLGRDLQLVYAPLVDEPLPEHLACIVEKLERRPEASCRQSS